MSRQWDVTAGRGRRAYASLFTDSAGSVDTATPALAPASYYAFPLDGTVKPLGPLDPGGPNVGCRLPAGSMTVVNGNYTVNTTSTISGLIFRGKVTFAVQGHLVDCRFEGPIYGQGPTYDGATTNNACVNDGYNGRGSLIEWCSIDMTGRENVWTDGIRGSNYTMNYCYITRTVDAIGASPSGNYGPTLIQGCRAHNGYYTGWLDSVASGGEANDSTPPHNTPYPGFPNTPSDLRCHGDCMQWQGGTGWTVRANYFGGQRGNYSAATIEAHRDYLLPADQPFIAGLNAANDYANSAIIIQNNHTELGTMSGLVENNWLEGGVATLQLDARNDSLSGVTIRNNRFIRTPAGIASNAAIFRTGTVLATVTGNVYDNDNAPVS